MESPAKGPSGSLGCQVGSQWGYGFGIVTRIICKLDCNRLSGALWNGAIQFLNSPFGLYPLIETDETDTFGEPLKRTKNTKKCKSYELRPIKKTTDTHIIIETDLN